MAARRRLKCRRNFLHSLREGPKTSPRLTALPARRAGGVASRDPSRCRLTLFVRSCESPQSTPVARQIRHRPTLSTTALSESRISEAARDHDAPLAAALAITHIGRLHLHVPGPMVPTTGCRFTASKTICHPYKLMLAFLKNGRFTKARPITAGTCERTGR